MKKFGFSWSWKRAVGLTGLRTSVARRTGIPTTRNGLERKIGAFFLKLFWVILIMVCLLVIKLLS